MQTLKVSACCYRNGPDGERQGILLHNEEKDQATLIDVATLSTIEIDEDCSIRLLPEQGCFSLLHSFTPELRKAVKESRRVARINPDDLKKPAPHRQNMRCGPKM